MADASALYPKKMLFSPLTVVVPDSPPIHVLYIPGSPEATFAILPPALVPMHT